MTYRTAILQLCLTERRHILIGCFVGVKMSVDTMLVHEFILICQLSVCSMSHKSGEEDWYHHVCAVSP